MQGIEQINGSKGVPDAAQVQREKNMKLRINSNKQHHKEKHHVSVQNVKA